MKIPIENYKRARRGNLQKKYKWHLSRLLPEILIKWVKDGKQVETPKDKRKETGKEPKKRANVTTKSWKMESYHIRVTHRSVNVLHSPECLRRRGSPKDTKVHWKPQSTQEKSCTSKDRDVGEAPQRKWAESLNQKQLNTQLTFSIAAPTSAGARLWALDRMTPSTGEHTSSLNHTQAGSVQWRLQPLVPGASRTLAARSTYHPPHLADQPSPPSVRPTTQPALPPTQASNQLFVPHF